MLDILLDSGRYAVENLAVPVAASLATLWANAKVAKRRAAAEDVADHDRGAAEINDDLRRWIHDRDREARVRMDEIRQDGAVQGRRERRRVGTGCRQGLSPRASRVPGQGHPRPA